MSVMRKTMAVNVKSHATPSLRTIKHKILLSKERVISQQMFQPSSNKIRITGRSLVHLTTLMPPQLRSFINLTSKIWSMRLKQSSWIDHLVESRESLAYSRRWTTQAIDSLMLMISDGVSSTTDSTSPKKKPNNSWNISTEIKMELSTLMNS